MSFNIWMWILLVLFIVGTIAVILILTVGSVLEERSYDRRSEDEKRKNLEKNLEMSKGHTDVSQESSNGEEQVTQEHSQHVVQDHQSTQDNRNN
ncbi:hypothetical protein [Staphylococcus epidermidis]|uniref:hypothetical protein n=1 Tax=Staphylococcus epidermidis TaxID=1282 RepID=UPI0011A07EC0|nr:hypothetical protein [Staphylococcus epidermidis]MCG2532447.1 hypothetical protein [Staphylococcus epidermidis]MCG2566464.1 hypothetical protein [Staphylococcus epidermidis]UYB67993.1 hypothetical protein N8145_01310 [Staphylococcus epidermidis]